MHFRHLQWLSSRKNLPAMQKTWVQSPLGPEDPLKKEMATHSSILTWEIPWTEETGRRQSTRSQKSQTGLSKLINKTKCILAPKLSDFVGPYSTMQSLNTYPVLNSVSYFSLIGELIT